MHIVIDGARLKTYKTTVPKPSEDDPDPEPVTAVQIDVTGMDSHDVAALHRLTRSASLTFVLSTTRMELGDVFGGTSGSRRAQSKTPESVTIGVQPAGQAAQSVTFTKEDGPRLEAMAWELERVDRETGEILTDKAEPVDVIG